ncbi:SDR family oxidoreductase [Rhodococcus sp. 3Y1]
MTTTSDIQSAVVIGGTGKTGARVAQRLTAVGIRTRIASRTSGTRFDWNDQATWQPAVSGVDVAYVTYAPDLAVPESSTHIEEFAELAYREGVRRMVLLSGRGEPAAQKAEQVLADSGLEWAVVRASWFAQNSEGYLLDPIRKATWHFRSVRWGAVHRRRRSRRRGGGRIDSNRPPRPSSRGDRSGVAHLRGGGGCDFDGVGSSRDIRKNWTQTVLRRHGGGRRPE